MRRLDAAVSAVMLAAGAAYIPLAAQFFPSPPRLIGHDYEYFLPLLLAGRYWIARNGILAIPYFSPAFCGGLPFLANPQSIFYSAPQLFSLMMDPVRAFLATTILFAWLGGLGTFLLMRQRFAASLPAAGLAAVVFMCNTFLLHRMAVGQITYHVIGLVPLLCHLLLTPLQRSADRRAIARAAGAAAGSAMILAYVVYAGAANIAVPIALTAAAVWLLHALLRRPVPSFWLLAPAAAILGGALAAIKLMPALVFIHQFPQPEPLWIWSHPGEEIRTLLAALFWPGAIPNLPGQEEFDYGVGFIPPIMILAGLAAALARGAWRCRPRLSAWLKLGALGLILAVPLWLNCGGPHFAAWLKTLPYLGENHVLLRWFLIYILPLGLAAGLILDYWTDAAETRGVVALAGIVATVAFISSAGQPYYLRQPQDIARALAADHGRIPKLISEMIYNTHPVLTADRALREYGHVPAIVGIGGSTVPRRNDALVKGLSAYPCYEPLFGFRLQNFPTTLGPGSALRDPVCYLYGPENDCRPGDPFPRSAAPAAAAFAAYRPFHFVLPLWQILSNSMTLAAAAVTILGLALAFWVWLRSLRQPPPASFEAVSRVGAILEIDRRR